MGHDWSKERQIQTACLIVLAAVALGFALYFLRPILLPFVLAAFLALLLRSIAQFLTKRLRFPYIVSLALALLSGFALLLVLGVTVVSSMADLASQAEDYDASLEEFLTDLIESLPLEQLERLGFDVKEEFDVDSLLAETKTADYLRGLTGAIVGIASQALLVTLFVLFILLGRKGSAGYTRGVALEIEKRVQKYLTMKTAISGVTGLLVFVVLELLGVPYAIAFGSFSFLLNYIPNIGSIVATLLPLPVVVLVPDIAPHNVVLAILIPGIIQFTVGNIVEPRVMGESLDIHPVVVLISLVFWGMLWGVIGMFLAVPLTSITKIILGRMEFTKPLADAMAGRIGQDT